jgi:purine-binding chemotaxis protein CheW
LRVGDVSETMRPLPVQKVPGAPAFVGGLAVIRGQPVPVVDLAVLVGAADSGAPGRFVCMRGGGRPVALAVESVVGIRALDPAQLQEVAPLVGAAVREIVQAVGAIDRELLMVLDAGRIISEGLWQSLELAGGAA